MELSHQRSASETEVMDDNDTLAFIRSSRPVAVANVAMTTSTSEADANVKSAPISPLFKFPKPRFLSDFLGMPRPRLNEMARRSLRRITLGIRDWNKQPKDFWNRFAQLTREDTLSTVLYKLINILQTSLESIKATLCTTIVSNKSPKMTYVMVCALALSGSSIGYNSFLYFVTVGYAASMLFVVVAATIASRFSKIPVGILDMLPSILVALWAVRLIVFSLHREFFNWPEWHYKMIDVDKRISMHTKVLAWLTYSPLYAAMVMPCVFRLQDAIMGYVHRSWGLAIGIVLQVVGLLLETVADYQKAEFKSIEGNRRRWCNIGLFGLFLYPNYLGECTFWTGTFIGNMACLHSFFQWGVSMVGLTFILSILLQAMSSLGEKQLKKYGSDEKFREFRLSHSF